MAKEPHHMVHTGVLLPPELREKLAEAAAQSGLPLSTYARIALASHLRSIDQKVAA